MDNLPLLARTDISSKANILGVNTFEVILLYQEKEYCLLN
jgi:hypothetical protein